MHKVYYLPKENYIGVTGMQMKERIKHHRKPSVGRNVNDWQVLFTGPHRVCLDIERRFHNEGYSGINNNISNLEEFNVSTKGKKITWEGIEYNSISECSRATGLYRKKIRDGLGQ